jgi:hypothetical protein
MRLFIIFAALVLMFALIGWISFSSGPGRSSINLETEEIREDTGEMMHKGSELLQDAEDEISPSETQSPEPARTNY